MIKYLILSLFLSSPLGINWKDQHSLIPVIPDYNYYYGDMYWNPVTYLGTRTFLGLETEIQLYFNNKKISKVLLILGPKGMNEYDCKRKYKKVIAFMNKKYGHYQHLEEMKEVEIDDLVFSAKCYPMLLGLHTIKTHWNTTEYMIEASLFGDSGGLYIEIIYINKNRIKNHTKKENKKILEKLSKEL